MKSLNTEPEFNEESNVEDIEIKKQDISTDIEKNLETFKKIFTVPDNADVKLREFTIQQLNRKAFLLYISTMADLNNIMSGIEGPLIDSEHPGSKIKDIVSYPIEKTSTNIGAITEFIAAGVTALLSMAIQIAIYLKRQKFAAGRLKSLKMRSL